MSAASYICHTLWTSHMVPLARCSVLGACHFPLARCLLSWSSRFGFVDMIFFSSLNKGAFEHYVMVSKFQWKQFWLATQRDPQKDCHPQSRELWRIRTGRIVFLRHFQHTCTLSAFAKVFEFPYHFVFFPKWTLFMISFRFFVLNPDIFLHLFKVPLRKGPGNPGQSFGARNSSAGAEGKIKNSLPTLIFYITVRLG